MIGGRRFALAAGLSLLATAPAGALGQNVAEPRAYTCVRAAGPVTVDGVREGVAALEGSGRKLSAGLYVPALGAFDLGRAVTAARRAGASGVALFEMDGLTNDHLAALAAALE